MAARLTDIQKKKIAADYLVIGSLRATGKLNGVSATTVKRILDDCSETEQNITQKKEENTKDIIAYMESQRGIVCDIIAEGLKILPEKIRNAKSAIEVTTAIGTLIDKFTAFTPVNDKSMKEDALSQSLRELAEDLESD